MPATTCTPVNNPAVEANYCAPILSFAQVRHMRFGNAGNPMADWTSLTEWNARLDNTDVADAAKIRTFHVIGSKPRPDRNTVTYSQNRKVYTDADHVINFTIDEVHDLNYAYLLWLEDQGQGQVIPAWFDDEKFLYGGNDGVQGTLFLDLVIDEDRNALVGFEGTYEWSGKHPARILNPLI